MPGLQGATLVELPRKLHQTLATKRELQGKGADISESVVHTAVMGLLLMTSEVMQLGAAGCPSLDPWLLGWAASGTQPQGSQQQPGSWHSSIKLSLCRLALESYFAWLSRG